MLSGAKHLQYLLENKQMQILRFAQDDRHRHFFRSLLRDENGNCEIGNLRFADRCLIFQR